MSDEEPNFYEEEEVNESNNIEKKDINCSFGEDIKNENKKNELTITMVNPINENKNKSNQKKNPIENNILLNIENEDEKEDNNKKEKEDNNDDKENDEPNFYDDEQNGENNTEEEKEKNDDNEKDNSNSINMDKDEKTQNEKKEKKESKFEKRNREKKEKLKKKNIEIKNIYEINTKFNMNAYSPLFYLRENKAPLDKYPWPLSSSQIVKIVEENNIPYESLKIKLVDIFEFRLKNAFEYVDFINVIKPEWASNVTYSNIFLELYNFKINEENGNNKDNKEDDKNKSHEHDENDTLKNLPSGIPKLNEAKTFTEEKKLLKILEEKDEEEDQNKNKYKPFWPKNKKKRGKRQKGQEIRGNFNFD